MGSGSTVNTRDQSSLSWLVDWYIHEEYGDIYNSKHQRIADLIHGSYWIGFISEDEPDAIVDMAVRLIGSSFVNKVFEAHETKAIADLVSGRGFSLNYPDSDFYKNNGETLQFDSETHSFKMQKFDNGYTIIPSFGGFKTRGFKSIENDLLGELRGYGI